MTQAEMFAWLAALKCNSFSLSRNDEHACNYMTAKQWIEDLGEESNYKDVDPAELAVMKETDTIWRLQVYVATPMSFVVWYGASMESVVSKAMKDWPGVLRLYPSVSANPPR